MYIGCVNIVIGIWDPIKLVYKKKKKFCNVFNKNNSCHLAVSLQGVQGEAKKSGLCLCSAVCALLNRLVTFFLQFFFLFGHLVQIN